MAEKYFGLSDCIELAAHEGPGLFIEGSESIEWKSTGVGAAEKAAMVLRSDSQLLALSVVDTRPSNDMDGLAVTFSRHLRETRSMRNGIIVPACVTSITPPHPPKECVRIPHLVTTEFSPKLTDTVIWEIQTAAEAEEWLGAPLIGQEFVEENLEKIINVRQVFRNGKIAGTDLEKELQNHLSKGRYLSVLLVFQHLNLFEDMLKEIE
jgi:hypothetical protein